MGSGGCSCRTWYLMFTGFQEAVTHSICDCLPRAWVLFFLIASDVGLNDRPGSGTTPWVVSQPVPIAVGRGVLLVRSLEQLLGHNIEMTTKV